MYHISSIDSITDYTDLQIIHTYRLDIRRDDKDSLIGPAHTMDRQTIRYLGDSE